MPAKKEPASSKRAEVISSPFSRDPELEQIADSCERFIDGAGRRRAHDLLATIPPETVIDYYGAGGVVAEVESEIARILGKPAALFLPTGTMAQQATLRIHADRRSRNAIAFHPTCHLDNYEERGYERLHGLFGVQSGDATPP